MNTTTNPLLGSQGFRLLGVTDTRQYEEIDDKWVPIHDSGHPRNCDRCGKEHVIYCTVQCVATNKVLCVGSGCARQSGMVDSTQHKSVESAAKTLHRLETELVYLEAELERVKEILVEVEALPLPPVEGPFPRSFGFEWRMGDMTGVMQRKPGPIESERVQCLESGWRRKRAEERGVKSYRLYDLCARVSDTKKRLERAKRKMAELLSI